MTFRLRALIGLLGLLAVAACAPQPVPTVLPTQPLPPTLIPTQAPSAATDDSLSAPSDLVTPTAPESSLLIPAAAQPLIQHAIDDLDQRLSVDADQIQIVRLESVTWSSPDLGCVVETAATPTTPVAGYRIVLSASDKLYEYHTDTSEVRACAQEGVTAGATAESLLIADPVAAELIALARREVVRTHGATASDLKLVDVVSVTWPDTGLGCPQPNTTYTPGGHDGYRIVVADGSTQYIFHSDFDHVIECAAVDEVLPPDALLVTPESTATNS